MYIVIHTEATRAKSDRRARHLADAIWALPLAAGASCVIVEHSDGSRYCVVGDPLEMRRAPASPRKKKQIDNPCDRCGFNVTSHNSQGDPLPQHSTERDCFRATCDAAVEEAKNAGR